MMMMMMMMMMMRGGLILGDRGEGGRVQGWESVCYGVMGTPLLEKIYWFNYCFIGFWVSWFLVSWLLGVLVSRFLGFFMSWFLGV